MTIRIEDEISVYNNRNLNHDDFKGYFFIKRIIESMTNKFMFANERLEASARLAEEAMNILYDPEERCRNTLCLLIIYQNLTKEELKEYGAVFSDDFENSYKFVKEDFIKVVEKIKNSENIKC